MDDLKELEKKIDHLQASINNLQISLNSLMQYTSERDENDFERDVQANLIADYIFESFISGNSFFDINNK